MKTVLKSINKYEPKWQLARVGLKKLKSLKEKENFIQAFLDSEPLTKERLGRVINWYEGLKRGYKAHSEAKVIVCDTHIENLSNLYNSTPLSIVEKEEDFAPIISSWGDKEIVDVYKSLYRYEKEFTSRGYRHKGLERLVDTLHDVMCAKDILLTKFRYSNVIEFRSLKKGSKNKSNFFF